MMIRLWRGELALWASFWIFGAGGGLLFGLPIFAAMLALTDVPDDGTASLFLSALAFLMLYLVWVFVGIWRAANTYRGDPVWAVGAKLAIASVVIMISVLVIAVVFADIG